MKKTLFFVTCGVLFLVSCDKLFINISGKEAELQGKLQMDNADTVYYNFQNNLFLYQIYQTKDELSQVYGYYTLYGDTGIELRLLREFADFPLDYLGWDTLHSVTNQDTIFKTFKIKKFTSKKLILSSNNGEISFHKF
jgi:hypothetical protein